ncbi:alpha/beta fold hydrolase [bacterium]|nr:alpha/beta fold hydrolase [bacterium]
MLDPKAVLRSILALALACGAAFTATGANASEEVSFTTSDGVSIQATFSHPKGRARVPAVILLHQLGGDRHAWNALAHKLTGNNYAVLAIDLRGHGGSTAFGESTRTYKDFSDADYSAMIKDVRAAAAYLRGRKDVNGGRLAVIGASIGANLSLQYAAEDMQVRTVVMLSPGLNYRSLKTLPYVETYDKRALFMVVAEGDAYSYESCRKIKEAARLASPLKLKVYKGGDHGTALLRTHEGLDEIIIAWLLNHLVNG